MNTHRWSIERPKPNGPVFLNVYGFAAGDTFDIFLGSDPHTESPLCDRQLLKRQLHGARDENMPIILAGDIFDLMQSRNDKRRGHGGMIPEIRDSPKPYLDATEDFVTDFYMPVKDHLAALFEGNHDSAISKHGDTNMVAKLVKNLRQAGSLVEHCGYFGWVFIRIYMGSGTRWFVRRLAVHHGYGGASPVTKGVIDTARIGVYLPDADATLMGHTHSAYVVPVARKRISAQCREYEDRCLHIRTPGWKNDHAIDGGFAIEKGIAPTCRGHAVLSITCPVGVAESGDLQLEARLVV